MKNVEIFKDSVELMPYFVAVMKLRNMMPSVKCLEQKMKVKLVKEPDNEYDKEAIKVEMPGIGHIGYVANSPYTVVGESYSAGRLYDKIGDTATRDCKEEYRQRYINRGNNQSFLDVFIERWDVMLDGLDCLGGVVMEIGEGQYLTDVIRPKA